MLPTARRVAIRHRDRYIWRTYTTETAHESESQREPSAGNQQLSSDDYNGPAEIPGTSIRSIYVRSYETPASMTDVFAIVRGVERKYGRIQDFRWPRDREMLHTYQNVLWATFYSSQSFERVPRTGETLSIPAPIVDTAMEGGAGFHALQDLLKPLDIVEDESEVQATDIMQRVLASGDPEKSESGPRMLDVKVERAQHDSVFYPHIHVDRFTRAKSLALAHALLDWGGFATLQPMFGSKSPYNSDQEAVPVDSEGMRKVLNQAAAFTSRPDPSFEKAKIPEAIKAEKEEELADEQAAPARPGPRSRSWSLPLLSPDSPRPELPPVLRTRRPPFTKALAAATIRQQQILPKAKQAKPAAGEKQEQKQKQQSAGGKRSPKDTGDTQNQEWTTSKKERNRLKESATPESGTKARIWDIVGRWF